MKKIVFDSCLTPESIWF